MYLWHWPIIVLTDARAAGGRAGRSSSCRRCSRSASPRSRIASSSSRSVRSGSRSGSLAKYGSRRRAEVVTAGAAALFARVRHSFHRAKHDERPRSRHDRRTTTTTRPPPRHPAPDIQRIRSDRLPPGHYLAMGDSVMLGCSSALRPGARLPRARRRVGLAADQRRDRGVQPAAAQVRPSSEGRGRSGRQQRAAPLRRPRTLRHALRGVPDVVVVNVRNATSWEQESNNAIAALDAGLAPRAPRRLVRPLDELDALGRHASVAAVLPGLRTRHRDRVARLRPENLDADCGAAPATGSGRPRFSTISTESTGIRHGAPHG